MDEVRIPAETASLAEHLGDEMLARGWNTDDVGIAMGGTSEDAALNMLVVALLLSVQEENLVPCLSGLHILPLGIDQS